MALTKQEEEFCYQYVKNYGNGEAAAIAAGYPVVEASDKAKELLKRDDIKAELKMWEPPKVIDPVEYWEARAEFGG